jgi:hypothetical protein
MKTSLVAVSILLTLAATLSAQPAPPAPAQLPVRTMSPAARSNMLARTGGLVQQPVAGPSLLIIDTQKRIAPALFVDTANKIRKLLSLSISAQSHPSSEPVTVALKALADTNTAAVIVIADIAGYPSLLIAPESRWAMINVAALGGPGVPADTLSDRVQKETWRAFGYLMGAAHSMGEHCLMKSVLAPEDLDALAIKSLSPEPFIKIMEQSQRLSMQPLRMTTYRKAAEGGWAPAPTNDIQRAIWNELKK